MKQAAHPINTAFTYGWLISFLMNAKLIQETFTEDLIRTLPLKGKLTVTRELRNSTRDSILENSENRVPSRVL